ncbi:MAG: IS607 family transposase [Pleurocapsa sp. SU_5_0]|nr:IS607 family transposase [Pleurocapsa sp. SU_5_0]NJR44780.1 IS607 family transposase [Hyellaceae cyanobacterium CSU_1_1]
MRPHEFAEQIGVSVETLRRWDRTGKLKAKRTPSNHRFYTEEDLLQAKGLKPISEERLIKVYCRVSSAKQKNELTNQKDSMEQFCLARGYAVDEWIEEIGGGLNFKRKKFLNLIEDALSGKIEIIVIAHKDRLCRFAFDLIEQLLSKRGCKIIVANAESLSPQAELLEDLMAVVHCFSCRLYGSRSYRKEKEKAIQDILNIPYETLLKLQNKVQC